MGYTHYFTQTRDYTSEEWEQVVEDIGIILAYTENEQGIAIRSWDGTGKPELTDSIINFNGAGADSCENVIIERTREPDPWDGLLGRHFCKTNRCSYDIAVVACLCYLATVAETHTVSSDGTGTDFVQGLELARQALPRYANMIDIPRQILENDRWCLPNFGVYSERYMFEACVDGYAYILDTQGAKRTYRFYSHFEAAQWAASHIEKPITVNNGWTGPSKEGGKSIFAAYGSFDAKRTKALERAQDRAFKAMLDGATGDRLLPPPAFVRPDQLAAMDDTPRAYSFTDLLKMADAA